MLDDLTNALSMDNYLSGFIPRFAVRICDGRWAPQSIPTPWMIAEEKWLVDELKKLQNDYIGKETEIVWSDEAKKLWDAKSKEFDKRGKKESAAVAAILSRLVEDIFPEFIIIFAVSENGMTFLGNTWSVDVSHFQEVEKAIEPYVDDAIRLCDQVGGEKSVKKVRRILERTGRMTRSELVHSASNLGMRTIEVDEALRTLDATGEVVSGKTRSKKGKETRIYEYHKKRRW